ncbi:hypothetical protein D3C85_1754410 [compost metagenome]
MKQKRRPFAKSARVSTSFKVMTSAGIRIFAAGVYMARRVPQFDVVMRFSFG